MASRTCGACRVRGPEVRRAERRQAARSWSSRYVPCSGCGRPCRTAPRSDPAHYGHRCRACAWKERTVTGPTEARRLRDQAKRLGDRAITPRSVYARDLGVCALCGAAVPPDFGTSWSASPSVDHVLPIVRGGQHVWPNVRLAHVGCNARRRAA